MLPHCANLHWLHAVDSLKFLIWPKSIFPGYGRALWKFLMSHIARLSLVERYACYTGSALLSKIFLFAAFQIWIIRTAQKPGRQRRCIFVMCFKSLTAPNLDRKSVV